MKHEIKLTLDWSHWMIGVNWSKASIGNETLRMFAVHFMPLFFMVSWRAEEEPYTAEQLRNAPHHNSPSEQAFAERK